MPGNRRRKRISQGNHGKPGLFPVSTIINNIVGKSFFFGKTHLCAHGLPRCPAAHFVPLHNSTTLHCGPSVYREDRSDLRLPTNLKKQQRQAVIRGSRTVLSVRVLALKDEEGYLDVV